MGYIRHNAIIVTSWNEKAIESAVEKAREIGLQILGPSNQATNGYRSILVCPDGSKEGWEESDQGDQRRAKFRDFLNGDGSTNLDWVEIAYGSDDQKASIVDHAWMMPN